MKSNVQDGMKTINYRKLAVIVAICMVLQINALKAQMTYAAPFAITTFLPGYAFSISPGCDLYLNSSSVALGQMWWSGSHASFNSGSNDSADGNCSIAVGIMCRSSGQDSSASGYGCLASGPHSVAFGYHNTATEFGSGAFGIGATASMAGAFAFGFNTTASAYFSLSTGRSTSASGCYSTSSGFYTSASAMDSFVVGVGNVGGGSPNTWVSTDPLFEVGNGKGGSSYTVGNNSSASGPSDAFVVYKNGNATAQGNVTATAFITTAPGGDIPMFTGTN